MSDDLIEQLRFSCISEERDAILHQIIDECEDHDPVDWARAGLFDAIVHAVVTASCVTADFYHSNVAAAAVAAVAAAAAAEKRASVCSEASAGNYSQGSVNPSIITVEFIEMAADVTRILDSHLPRDAPGGVIIELMSQLVQSAINDDTWAAAATSQMRRSSTATAPPPLGPQQQQQQQGHTNGGVAGGSASVSTATTTSSSSTAAGVGGGTTMDGDVPLSTAAAHPWLLLLFAAVLDSASEAVRAESLSFLLHYVASKGSAQLPVGLSRTQPSLHQSPTAALLGLSLLLTRDAPGAALEARGSTHATASSLTSSTLRPFSFVPMLDLPTKREAHSGMKRPSIDPNRHFVDDAALPSRMGDATPRQQRKALPAIRAMIACGHKVGQLYATIDAKILLGMKKEFEALNSAALEAKQGDELNACGTEIIVTPPVAVEEQPFSFAKAAQGDIYSAALAAFEADETVTDPLRRAARIAVAMIGQLMQRAVLGAHENLSAELFATIGRRDSDLASLFLTCLRRSSIFEETRFFRLFRQPVTLVGFPVEVEFSTGYLPSDAFLRHWASIATYLLDRAPLPWEELTWHLATLAHYVAPAASSKRSTILQAATICLPMVCEIADMLRRDVAFRPWWSAALQYIVEVLDVMMSCPSPPEILQRVLASLLLRTKRNPLESCIREYTRRLLLTEDPHSLFGQRRPQDTKVFEVAETRETLFWPNAFDLSLHMVRMIRHFRHVSVYARKGALMQLVEVDSHPISFMINPFDGCALQVLASPCGSLTFPLHREMLQLIVTICESPHSSPLLTNQSWTSTYIRFLYLSFLQVYNSQLFVDEDPISLKITALTLRALGAIVAHDENARVKAHQLGIVSTLVQEVDLEQSVGELRERYIRRSTIATNMSEHRTSDAAGSVHGEGSKRLFSVVSEGTTPREANISASVNGTRPTSPSTPSKEHPNAHGREDSILVPLALGGSVSGGGASLPSLPSLVPGPGFHRLSDSGSLATAQHQPALSSPPQQPAPRSVTIVIPKLSLASAPPPLYYTSNGDTGGAVEAAGPIAFPASAHTRITSPTPQQAPPLPKPVGPQPSLLVPPVRLPERETSAAKPTAATVPPANDSSSSTSANGIPQLAATEFNRSLSVQNSPVEFGLAVPTEDSQSPKRRAGLESPTSASGGAAGGRNPPSRTAGSTTPLTSALKSPSSSVLRSPSSGAGAGGAAGGTATRTPRSPKFVFVDDLAPAAEPLHLDEPPLIAAGGRSGAPHPANAGGELSSVASGTMTLIPSATQGSNAKRESLAVPGLGIAVTSGSFPGVAAGHRLSSGRESTGSFSMSASEAMMVSRRNDSVNSQLLSVGGNKSLDGSFAVDRGLYPLQLLQDAGRFTAHQRSMRRVYVDAEVQVEVLYLILLLAVRPEGMLDERIMDSYTVCSKKINILFYLHMHINHHSNHLVVEKLKQRCRASSTNRGVHVLLRLLISSPHFAELYSSRDRIGNGAYGVVCAARVTLSAAADAFPFACKYIPVPRHIDDRAAIISLHTEVMALIALQDHPGVCRLVDFGNDGAQYVVVMHRYRTSLSKWREQHGIGLDPARLPEYFGLFLHVVDLVQAAHFRGIVHYDLKCDNFFLDVDERGEVYVPHFGDFGEAELLIKEDETQASSTYRSSSRFVYERRARGTEVIRSPECLLPHKYKDRRRKMHQAGFQSDVWSLGCLAFELFTGRHLFHEEHYMKLVRRVTSEEGEILEIDHKAMLGTNATVRNEISNFLLYVLCRDPQRRPLLTELRMAFLDLIVKLNVEIRLPPAPAADPAAAAAASRKGDSNAASSPLLPPPSATRSKPPTPSAASLSATSNSAVVGRCASAIMAQRDVMESLRGWVDATPLSLVTSLGDGTSPAASPSTRYSHISKNLVVAHRVCPSLRAMYTLGVTHVLSFAPIPSIGDHFHHACAEAFLVSMMSTPSGIRDFARVSVGRLSDFIAAAVACNGVCLLPSLVINDVDMAFVMLLMYQVRTFGVKLLAAHTSLLGSFCWDPAEVRPASCLEFAAHLLESIDRHYASLSISVSTTLDASSQTASGAAVSSIELRPLTRSGDIVCQCLCGACVYVAGCTDDDPRRVTVEFNRKNGHVSPPYVINNAVVKRAIANMTMIFGPDVADAVFPNDTIDLVTISNVAATWQPEQVRNGAAADAIGDHMSPLASPTISPRSMANRRCNNNRTAASCDGGGGTEVADQSPFIRESGVGWRCRICSFITHFESTVSSTTFHANSALPLNRAATWFSDFAATALASPRLTVKNNGNSAGVAVVLAERTFSAGASHQGATAGASKAGDGTRPRGPSRELRKFEDIRVAGWCRSLQFQPPFVLPASHLISSGL